MSRHKCSRELYCTFLKVTSDRYSAFSLSEVAPDELSHDSVSRWLAETKTQPKDVWSAAKSEVLDTRLTKTRSKKIELVHPQYSGAEHGITSGIGLLNFLWVAEDGQVCPTDFRIWEPAEDGKTKNDHFREMLRMGKERGINPEAVLADAWYSSLNNLKCIRDLGWNWVMRLKKNRKVNRNQRLDETEVSESGTSVQ